MHQYWLFLKPLNIPVTLNLLILFFIAILPLLTATSHATDAFTVRDSSDGQQDFQRRFPPYSFGDGWGLLPEPGSPQTTTANDHYWVEIQFKEVLKVRKVMMQENKDTGVSGRYWIKYGLDRTNLTTYQWEDGVVKVMLLILIPSSHSKHLFLIWYS